MLKTYFGSCHCKKVRFEIDADIKSVRVCNCSVCLKRGALICRIEEDCFRLQTPLAEMNLYEWGTKTGKDYFCSNCGILPFRRPSQLTKKEIEEGKTPFSGWAINVRCIEGIDLSTLELIEINGRVL